MLINTDKRFAQDYAKTYSDGDLIFLEGDDTREMYIVQEGEVAVTKKTVNGEVLLAVLKRGDFVGEMALLESLPRSGTARARGHTKLLVIQPGGFLLKIRRDPTFAFEMLQILSRRIRMTNDRLLEATHKKQPFEGVINSILQKLEYFK